MMCVPRVLRDQEGRSAKGRECRGGANPEGHALPRAPPREELQQREPVPLNITEEASGHAHCVTRRTTFSRKSGRAGRV